MTNMISKMLDEDQMIKLTFKERNSAHQAMNDAIKAHYSIEHPLTRKFWGNCKDDLGRLMCVPAMPDEVRETHPNLIYLRVYLDKCNHLCFEAKLCDIMPDHDYDLIGCVPIATGMYEVRDLICDPNMCSRIASLTEFWPALLVCYKHEIEEDLIEKYGPLEEDPIPF